MTYRLPLALPADLAALPLLADAHVVAREPELEQRTRWRSQRIGGRPYEVAQPVTFTPYASVQPCSARCRFCSENLRTLGSTQPAAVLRPGPDYFGQLARVLAELRGLPLSYSLSGLETTDDPDWMCRMLEVLAQHASASPVEQRVLYSNGAGFAGPEAQRLVASLQRFELSWLELSRHHFDAEQNQQIMRFRAGQPQGEAEAFAQLVTRLSDAFTVKLVCIVQRGGIDSAALLTRYLAWAHALGVRQVIVREFSKLDTRYVSNGTARYIDGARVDVRQLLQESVALLGGRLSLHTITAGYYFWNVIGSYEDMQVTFEVADYARMHAQHDSRRVYKLVFHASGVLCAGWDPSQHQLFDARADDSQELSRGE